MNNKDNAVVSGVYQIRNTINSKCYVGSTNNHLDRIRRHRRALRCGCHHSIHLQRAWNKYGEDAFSFEMIEEVATDKLIEREQHWIDTMKSASRDHGYNIAPTAGSSMLGYHHTEETKEKLRAWDRSKLPHAALVTYKGVTKPRLAHAKDHGLDSLLVAHRMQQGWTIDEALETPVAKANLFTFDGKTQSIPAWSKETGIHRRTIGERLYRFGWTVEEALTTVARVPVEYNGHFKLVSEWAAEFRLEPSTLRRRLDKGMSMEEALKPPRPKKPNGQGRKKGGRKGPAPMLITAYGKTQELRQWAKQYNMKSTTLWARLKQGWTIEHALTVEVKTGRTPNALKQAYISS